ncbi:unnamed protein product, partial [Cunninghamella echinulata]
MSTVFLTLSNHLAINQPIHLSQLSISLIIGKLKDNFNSIVSTKTLAGINKKLLHHTSPSIQ